MLITDYKGKSLLSRQTLEQIEKQADLLIKQKDVAGAYYAAESLKTELSKIDQKEVEPVLNKYRSISSKLKALALPLLPQEEIENLLKNNLDFLDTASGEYLIQGLNAYLASQPDEKQVSVKKALLKALDKDSVFSGQIQDILSITKDDEELENSAQKAGQINFSQSREGEIETIARQIFSQSGLSVSEEDFVRRARALIDSRLRDVRTKTDLAQYLSRPIKVGGLGLSGEALDFAQRKIEEEYARINKMPKRKFPQKENKSRPQDIHSKDQEPSEGSSAHGMYYNNGLEKNDTQLQTQTKSKAQEELDQLIKSNQHESAPLEDILKNRKNGRPQEEKEQKASDQNQFDRNKETHFSEIGVPVKSISQEGSKPGAEQKLQPSKDAGVNYSDGTRNQGADLGFQKNIKSQRRGVQDGKVRLDDIKSSYQTKRPASQSRQMVDAYGLSDEFSMFTLSDFRSFGGVQSAPEKILSKLKVLEEESLENKRAGIKSFYHSPLYRQYLSIGNASLSKDKSLSQALADKQINPEEMTEDEFFAISDLNGKIK